MRRTAVPLALALSIWSGLEAAGGAAAKVLSPTLFAGWQTRNVSDPVVVRDPARGGLRMFYSGSATEQASDAAWDLWATGAAVSRDGRRWTWLGGGYEPVLEGHRFLEGEVVEPARAAAFDALEARVGSVLREGSRWRMWYTGWSGDDRAVGAGRFEKVHFRVGAAVSDDGARWTKQAGSAGSGAVLGLGTEGAIDALAAGSPAVARNGTGYRMWYEAYDGTAWRIAAATSPDGLTWTKEGLAIDRGAAGALDGSGARHPVVVALPSGYELWYQGRSAAAPSFHVLRATSTDGRAWRRVEGEVALHPDPPATADEEIRVGSVLVRADGAREVYFAKETGVRREAAFGTVETRTTAIYAEVVGARE